MKKLVPTSVFGLAGCRLLDACINCTGAGGINLIGPQSEKAIPWGTAFRWFAIKKLFRQCFELLVGEGDVARGQVFLQVPDRAGTGDQQDVIRAP